VKITTIWCLHKFPHNAHSHVQQAYWVNEYLTWYVALIRCWLYTTQASPFSKVGWATWVNGFKVVFPQFFSYLPPNICYLWTLFFVISIVCVMVSNSNGEPPHQLINSAPTSKTLCVKRNQCFRASWYNSIFVCVFWLEWSICQKPTIHNSKTPSCKN